MFELNLKSKFYAQGAWKKAPLKLAGLSCLGKLNLYQSPQATLL